MRITDELLAAHMCGWDQVTLASDTTTGAKAVAARSLSRRQVLGGFGALTAAALLTACTQSQPPAPGAGGTPATGGAPAVNPSVTPAKLGNVTNGIDEVQVWQEDFYKDLHRHPDLWGEERRTAGKVTAKLQEIGADEVLQIGGGVVGIFRNGDGRRVLFRADMDALPVTEATNLDYASQEPGKMHACGHDAHVAAGLAAAALLARNKSEWAGTYLALFQPGEETGKGAQAMVDDGLVTKLAANQARRVPGAARPERARFRPSRHAVRCRSLRRRQPQGDGLREGHPRLRCRIWGSTPRCWPRRSSCGCRASSPGKSRPATSAS